MSFISPRNIVFAPLLAAAFMAGIALAGSGAQPLAGECTLDPLTLPLFDATPAAEIAATPLAGNPGSDTGDEAIREAVEGIVACINTGDAAYAYAIFTQRYLAEQLADSSATYQPEFEQQLSFGPSEVEETFELVDVTEITVLDNGLVSVVVELSAGGTSYRDTLVLANVDGVWLIDGIEAFDPPR
ncbi:MAG: nuclear transport factor 2 family protein [Chloroflexia bacterium]|nr:nuclear transport factor 2 family protein [Chloroflexia bacterium]